MFDNEIENKKIKKSFYLTDEKFQQFQTLQRELKMSTIGDVIEYLIDNHFQSQSQEDYANHLAEVISRKVLEEQYERLDILRRRTGFADKQLKILMNMFNHLIIERQFDLESDVFYFDYKNSPSKLYQKALENFDEEINHYKERKKQNEIQGKSSINPYLTESVSDEEMLGELSDDE